MTLTCLKGGIVVDPAHGRDQVALDLFIRDGRLVENPGTPAHDTIDIAGKIVMAGGIDIHSHIGGGKVNLARTIMAADHAEHTTPARDGGRSGSGYCTPSSFLTGYRYAEMGYTAAFEPAMVPANARQAHAEMSDIPLIDKGCYALLGNDEAMLNMIAAGADDAAIADYVAWTLRATQALAIKVVNPGGINAFKFNQRHLGLDAVVPRYGVTPRHILRTLAGALKGLGIRHPLHVHCNDLGVPGNADTTLATIAAAEGLPLHLTHLQFHSYGREGDRKFSSAAARIAEAVNARPEISVDVGQIMFGQTVTASADTMAQYLNHPMAKPPKWICMDIEGDAGCGLVPFRYREQSFVNALQWAIGLELFLLIDDPWRVFLTTDHPNGAPFTTYPHLIRLLMDRSFRADMLRTIHPGAAAASALGSIKREYSLYEIAVLTRAGPAKSLGLDDRGHLGPGAAADIAVYDTHANKETMFAKPAMVFKDGEIIARNGAVVAERAGATHVAVADFDAASVDRLRPLWERHHALCFDNFAIADGEIEDGGRGRLIRHRAKRTG